MEVLSPVHWEAVTPELRDRLQFMGTCTFVEHFYLAGGTALALRLGHRRSIDLDFFSNVDTVNRATRREILRALGPRNAQAIEATEGNLLLDAQGVHVGFFSYGYPLLDPTEDVEGIAVAGIVDIGLMKLDALISWGSPQGLLRSVLDRSADTAGRPVGDGTREVSLRAGFRVAGR